MLNQSQLFALLLVAVSVKMYFYHRSKQYKGEYNLEGKYTYMSAVKHDMWKIFIVQLLVLLVYGLKGDKFIDFFDPINSWVGKTGVLVAGFFVYHELVESEVLSKYF